MRNKIILLSILLLAIFFRFNNLNWDSNWHLHPDERFLTMVGGAMKLPSSFLDYLNQNVSTMNPANVGNKFFVYGVFPLVLNKLFAVFLGNDNYNTFTIQGRFLSAFFDLLTTILVYKISKLLIKDLFSKKQLTINNQQLTIIPLFAAFFYSIAVFPIQLSHFFAVDTFLTFFMLGSFYFALRFWSRFAPQNDKKKNVILANERSSCVQNPILLIIFSGIFFGLALSCKISALYILPLNLFFIISPVILNLFQDPINKKKILKQVQNDIWRIFIFLTAYFILAYFALRLADPYYFQSTNFFDPRPNKDFALSIKNLSASDPKNEQIAYVNYWYPPGVQWIEKKPSFLLINTAIYGVGLPYFILIIIGLIRIISKFRNRKMFHVTCYMLCVVVWVLGVFFYQSIQFVKSMRYTIYLYPFFAIFAAVGLEKVMSYVLRVTKKKALLTTSYLLLTTILLVWSFMFSSIYLQKHSRVEASEWIYKNFPTGSLILTEYWDDGLPLPLEKNYGKIFKFEQLSVFDSDTPEKWQKMNELLNKADYYILSSNRGWGSIMDTPLKYPKMSKFYQDLLANKTQYRKIKEFTSYPQFQISNFKFQINDQWSEELFTVYDHPKVMIFRNEKTKE